MTKRTFSRCLFPAALLAIAPAAAAQDATPVLPKADELLTTLAEKLGGTDAPSRIERTGTATQFWVTTGASTPVSKGTFTERHDGARYLLEVALKSGGPFIRGSDGESVFERDNVSGARLLEGPAAAATSRLFRMLRGGDAWRADYDAARTVCEAVVDGRPVYEIALTPAAAAESAKPDVWHLGRGDGLLRRIAMPIENALGEDVTMQIDLTDWHADAHGAMHAKKRVIRFSQMRFDLETAATSSPKSFADDAFALPPGLRAADGTAEIRIEEIPSYHTATIRKTITMEAISRELSVMLPEVMFHLNSVGAEVLHAPFTRYHSMDGQTVDIEVGFAIKEPIEAKGRIQPSTLPGGRVVTTWHVGPYHELPKTYGRVGHWMAKKGLEMAGGSWEYYWTDPGLEPNPKRWRTQVFWTVPDDD